MLKLYAIRHKKTGRFVTGTNFNYSPPRQMLSDYHAPLILTGYDLLTEVNRRCINMVEHEVVPISIKEAIE